MEEKREQVEQEPQREAYEPPEAEDLGKVGSLTRSQKVPGVHDPIQGAQEVLGSPPGQVK